MFLVVFFLSSVHLFLSQNLPDAAKCWLPAVVDSFWTRLSNSKFCVGSFEVDSDGFASCTTRDEKSGSTFRPSLVSFVADKVLLMG